MPTVLSATFPSATSSKCAERAAKSGNKAVKSGKKAPSCYSLENCFDYRFGVVAVWQIAIVAAAAGAAEIVSPF